jgi:uncharacterized repeat protein (TIGR03803 family)
LVLSGNALYGTVGGGSSGNGAVFASQHQWHGFYDQTNSDGALPSAGLVLSGETLYGTADSGGSSDNGTVFALNTDGTDFENLHSFKATSGTSSTNSDGANPEGALVLSGNASMGRRMVAAVRAAARCLDFR